MATKRFVSKDNLGRVWMRLFGKVLNSKEEIEANTSENMIAGADAVKEVYSSLKDQPTFEYDSTGKITGYKTKVGADTVFPFSGGNFELVIVVRVAGRNYAGVQASAKGTITIKCVDGKITYTPSAGQSFANSSYSIWQGDQTWTAQEVSIVSVTYTPL